MLKKLIKRLFSLTPYQIVNKRYLDKKFQIAEATDYEKELCLICLKYSMTPMVRIWALINAIKSVRDQNINGDIVETGVWKGGNLILSQLLIENFGMEKKSMVTTHFRE